MLTLEQQLFNWKSIFKLSGIREQLQKKLDNFNVDKKPHILQSLIKMLVLLKAHSQFSVHA